MFEKVRSILFLGIGGVSMHQLALAYKELGYIVFGYDSHESEYTRLCVAMGIPVTYKFDSSFLDVDICVKTGAIKEDNKFVRLLHSRGCEIVDRAKCLADISHKFKCVIAVAGTHGKSTTASLIYEILRVSGKKVSCHIGADVFEPRFRVGDDYLVVEACEYNKSFLALNPTISIITNVEADHMDSYGSMFNLRSAFATFSKRGKSRFVFKGESTEYLRKIKNVEFVENTTLELKPKIKGRYNMWNISLAIAVARSLGVLEDKIKVAVNNFTGIARRYEYEGVYNGVKIYTDYAHHPTEIAEFLRAFKSEFPNSLIIFQPHTYSRTKMLLNDFISIFKDEKNLVIYKEYPAREKKTSGLSARDLFYKIKEKNPHVTYAASAKNVIKKIRNYQAVAFVGAGDINTIAQKITKKC